MVSFRCPLKQKGAQRKQHSHTSLCYNHIFSHDAEKAHSKSTRMKLSIVSSSLPRRLPLLVSEILFLPVFCAVADSKCAGEVRRSLCSMGTKRPHLTKTPHLRHEILTPEDTLRFKKCRVKGDIGQEPQNCGHRPCQPVCHAGRGKEETNPSLGLCQATYSSPQCQVLDAVPLTRGARPRQAPFE